jgi:hypothetical protein
MVYLFYYFMILIQLEIIMNIEYIYFILCSIGLPEGVTTTTNAKSTLVWDRQIDILLVV